jgi:hypothetical protein
MGDAEMTWNGLPAQALRQLGDFAQCPTAVEVAVNVNNSNAGGIVTAVFETLESFQKNPGDVSLSSGSDNSAHGFLLLKR